MRMNTVLCLALLTLGADARLLHADIISETGDAGDLPATATRLFGPVGRPPDAITGTISTTTDVDMYLFYIEEPARFSATTFGTGGTLQDTQLFLFRADGRGVYANDDISLVNRYSTLPAGSSVSPT